MAFLAGPAVGSGEIRRHWPGIGISPGNWSGFFRILFQMIRL
jgi:hypothetical protein